MKSILTPTLGNGLVSTRFFQQGLSSHAYSPVGEITQELLFVSLYPTY